MVTADLSLAGHPNMFVIGDLACVRTGSSEKGLPGVAPVAIQEGRYVAELIRTHACINRPLPAFQYHHQGNLATVGRNRAVSRT